MIEPIEIFDFRVIKTNLDMNPLAITIIFHSFLLLTIAIETIHTLLYIVNINTKNNMSRYFWVLAKKIGMCFETTNMK